MMKKRLSKKIWYGSDVDSEGNPVLPPLAIDSNDLEGLHYGELYLHIADDKLSLWTRTLTDQVKQIGGSGSGDGELWQLRQTDAGEPYLFSPFDVAVQRGLTSFVDGGSLDLPSIYDGLPIDNQTLYWEEVKEEVGTDEDGNSIYETTKVLKSAGGGGGTGGGSVLLPLSWSGFSNGSWDGSEAKTIVIPSKLSDLENDGFFKDYGWVQGDANEKKFGSYFLSGAVDNIPISNGQLLAFNGADGTQFFVWENHFYHRQNWGGGWHGWRKVISGDSNGVIDFNLEVKGEEGGNIKFVDNLNGCIENGIYELTSIRHALRFPWFDDAYEIGTIRSNTADAWGFGVTYQNNQLVWRVDRERMDVYGDLRIKNGLIRYNETEGYFYIDGNLVVSGGLTAFADEGAGNQWIMDVETLEEVVSDNPFKTYSAKVVSMIASNITNTKEVEDGVKEALDKLDIIKDGLSPITTGSSTTISVLRDTLVSIRSKLIAYVRDTE